MSRLGHTGVGEDGRICEQLDRLHEACYLQHCSRYSAILQSINQFISSHTNIILRQNVETQGLNSDAGNFMLVTGKQRAALAAVSAGMFT